MENSQNNIGYFPQMPICNKHLSVELNSDYTLPDYQPEIRRLLSIRATILPLNKYIGNSNAEINGDITYKITYLGADGELYCVALSDKYSFSSPLDYNLHNVNSDEAVLIPSCVAENVNARLLGPRKLNVRTKLSCKALAFSPALYTPNFVGSHNKSSIENLISEANCINIKCSANEAQVLNDFISFDAPCDNIRIIDLISSVIINECTALNDKIAVRGDVLVKVLYCNEAESSHPMPSIKKIPFSYELACTGVNSLYECVAQGVCYDERFDFTENGVALELTLSLFATAQRNEKIKYIADAYSTERISENSTSKLKLTNALRALCGNLTQNDVFHLQDLKLSQNAKIIEVMGKSSINELEADGTKMIFKGNNDYQLIYFLDGEYSSLTFSAPIKYELDSRSTPSVPKTFSWHADSSISSVRARHDGERLFVDCELNFGINLRCEQEIGILDEMIFSEYLDKKRSEILLCYPEKNASIWSVAKQYGEPQRSIRQKNAIPENENSVKRRYLVI